MEKTAAREEKGNGVAVSRKIGTSMGDLFGLKNDKLSPWSARWPTKYPCFLCLCNTRERKNVINYPLIESQKIIFPPLLGLMKQLVKALDKNGSLLCLEAKKYFS